MPELPQCPTSLPSDILNAASALAAAYLKSSIRPRLDPQVLGFWDRLIEEWANCSSLPLLIRKQHTEIGNSIRHKTGRDLAPCDNSPAHWAIRNAFEKGCDFSINDVQQAFQNHEIPMTMAMNKSEISEAKYKGVLARQVGANKRGWKLDHIEPVGLKIRGPIESLDISNLKKHFCLLMKPSNMILVPTVLKGLGDMPCFLEAVKNEDNG